MEKDKPIEIVLGNKNVAEAGSQQVNITQNNITAEALASLFQKVSEGFPSTGSGQAHGSKGGESDSGQQVPQPSTKSPQPSKRKRKDAPRIVEDTFTYKWLKSQDGQMRLIKLYQTLIHKNYGWLDENAKPDDWCAMFKGEAKPFMMKWTGTQAYLKHLFKLMIDRGYITESQSAGKWEVVGSHFTDGKGKPFTTDWNRVAAPKRGVQVIERLADMLDISKPLADIDPSELDFTDGEYEQIADEDSHIIKGATKYSRKKSEEDW